MKKKTMVKIALDALMLIVLALMYQKNALGMAFHEVGGLMLIGAFAVHKLLNFDWIKNVTRRLFDRKLAARARFMYALDACLLILFVLIGVSGAMISKVVFSVEGGGQGWKTVHYFCSALAITLIGVHIGLHFQYLSGICKRKIHPARALAVSLVVIMCLIGGYAMATGSYFRWLAMPFTASGQEQHMRMRMTDNADMPDGADMSFDAETTDGADMPDGDETPSGAGRGARNRGQQRGKGQSANPLTALWVFVRYACVAGVWATVTVLAQRFAGYKKAQRSAAASKDTTREAQ